MNSTAIIFDLEATCQDKKIQQHFDNELLEIGAVKVDETGTIIDQFDVIVIPTRTTLTSFCTELTGITKEMVQNEGINFTEAMNQFKEFSGNLPVFSWGFYDKKQLKKDSLANNYPLKNFLSNHRSLKHEHGELYELKRPIGVTWALKMFKESFTGKHHRGIDDAINIATIFKHMLKNPKFKI